MNFKRLVAIKFAPRKLIRRSFPGLLRLTMSMTDVSALSWKEQEIPEH